MEALFYILLSIVFSGIWGFLLYFLAIGLVPKNSADKFFEMVPLYPKKKYAILMYTFSGVLYAIISYNIFGTFETRTVGVLAIAPICLIVSSQLVRAIARGRSENLEESFEEEKKRKENNRFNL